MFGGLQVFNGSPGSSGNPPGFAEAIEVLDPPVGTYVARVVNYAATGQTWELTARRLYREPDVFTDLGKREAWTVSCESADGKTVYQKRTIEIERGERKSVAFACGAKRANPPKANPPKETPPRANPPTGNPPKANPEPRSKADRLRAAKRKRAACITKAKKLNKAKKRRAAKAACRRNYRRKARRIRNELARRRTRGRGWRT